MVECLNPKLALAIFLVSFVIWKAAAAQNWSNSIFLSLLWVMIVQFMLDFRGSTQYAKGFFLTIWRDGRALMIKLKFVKVTLNWLARHKKSPARLLDDTAKSMPYKTALIQAETGQRMTFFEMNQYVNSVANLLIGKLSKSGLKKGDTVALICDNRIEYGPIWLGMNRVGVVPALINYKLAGKGLKHCLEIVDTKAVIALSEFVDNVIECGIDEKIKIYELTGAEDLPSERRQGSENCNFEIIDFKKELQTTSNLPPEEPYNYIPDSLSDIVMYIYTSGTTGLPKAAKISINRFATFGYMIKYLYRIKRSDSFYNCLPLYHSNGGMVVFAQNIIDGCTMILPKKFSASRFWDDIVKYSATSFNYIGETCRFLLAKKVTPSENHHKIRFIIGNGLKPELWKNFIDRFRIPRVCEFYGATEGVANLANTENKVGSVGFISVIAPFLHPVLVLKVDMETEEVLRDSSTGKALVCKPNEVGMLAGRIEQKGYQKMDGYNDPKAMNSKIVMNVLNNGDKFFKTGDLVTYDELGWVTFKDRTGDTFRWKGENCSTAEVDAAASRILNDNNLAVACVSCLIPGNEGNAGLLVIDNSAIPAEKRQALTKKMVENLSKNFKNELPAYQIPQILRITSKVEVTGTFKIQKAKVKKLGYDINQLPGDDECFVLQRGEYVKIDEEVYRKIVEKELRF